VRGLGADHALNSKTVKVADAIQELTAKKGAEVVFDTTGMMFSEGVEMAAMEGRIPVITAPKDGGASFNLRSLYRKALRIQGIDSLRLSAAECAA